MGAIGERASRSSWSSPGVPSPGRAQRPRRTDVVGIFPGRGAIIRLVGAVLAEQNDEWTEARRYIGPEILAAFLWAEEENEANEAHVTIEAIGA
jgi:putative transposase